MSTKATVPASGATAIFYFFGKRSEIANLALLNRSLSAATKREREKMNLKD
jgi:hypothetical protein